MSTTCYASVVIEIVWVLTILPRLVGSLRAGAGGDGSHLYTY